MSQKTPISVLQELCVKEGDVLIFDDFPHEPNPKIFSCEVKALDVTATGSGRSKKEARHEASANLIAQLAQMKRYKDKLPVIPQIGQVPHPTTDGDAVCCLLDICIQRQWPLATFEVQQACGEPHRPVFTVLCQLSSIKRTGVFSTKKGAKQIAARLVLEIIQRFNQNQDQMQIATIESEPPEKLFLTYRELRKSEIKPIKVSIRNRHNFFLRLPKEDRDEIKKILIDQSGIYGTNKDKVNLACAAMKVKYSVQNIPDHPRGYEIFSFYCSNHDCVIIDKEPDLYDRVIDHFKIMLNIQQF